MIEDTAGFGAVWCGVVRQMQVGALLVVCADAGLDDDVMDTKAGGNLSKLLGGIPLTLYYNGFDATDNVSACAAPLCLSVSWCCS